MKREAERQISKDDDLNDTGADVEVSRLPTKFPKPHITADEPCITQELSSSESFRKADETILATRKYTSLCMLFGLA